MSVMFSISALFCRTGKTLMPLSGSTQEILVLLQEQDWAHASADIHGSPEPTATPTVTTHHQKHRHDPDPLPGEEGAQLRGLEALISGATSAIRLAEQPHGPAQVGWDQPRISQSVRREDEAKIPMVRWMQAALES